MKENFDETFEDHLNERWIEWLEITRTAKTDFCWKTTSLTTYSPATLDVEEEGLQPDEFQIMVDKLKMLETYFDWKGI